MKTDIVVSIIIPTHTRSVSAGQNRRAATVLDCRKVYSPLA